MWIKRDFERKLAGDGSRLALRVLTGPRQCGKTAILFQTLGSKARFISLDDLQNRLLAQKDPALFLGSETQPLLIDEAQYAPHLFPELKLRIDRQRREGRTSPPIWLTGSSTMLMDKTVQESLAGRASFSALHTLSVSELRGHAVPREMFLKGGWPELYVHPQLDPAAYLDDYIRSFIEKDIALTAGVQKIGEFLLSLKLLASRTGQMANLSEVGAQSGASGSALQDWIALLERNSILKTLAPYHSNLNKRLIKTPKIYLLDTGLASRLQGWRTLDPILQSPQAGALFETLVLGELIRTRDHNEIPLEVFYWRTKEGAEVDFLVRLETATGLKWLAIESKLASQNVSAQPFPKSFDKSEFEGLRDLWIVTLEGERRELGKNCVQIPIDRLRDEILAVSA